MPATEEKTYRVNKEYGVKIQGRVHPLHTTVARTETNGPLVDRLVKQGYLVEVVRDKDRR